MASNKVLASLYVLNVNRCSLGSAINNMLLAFTSFFFWAFSSVVTGPGIVEVEVSSALAVVQGSQILESGHLIRTKQNSSEEDISEETKK
ncbi:hypothetical protein Tco_1433707, partial [Tanacetum coccineum]